MKRHFKLQSARTGKVYTIADREVQEFYQEHVMGASPDRALPGRGHHPIRLIGTLLIQLFNPDLELKDVRAIRNLVTNAGKDAVADRLQGVNGPPAVFDYLAIGTGTTAAAAGDTTLQTETGTRVQGTLSQPTSTTDRLVGTFAAGNGTAAITEAGRLNASSSGTLLIRQVFSAINKAAGDSLQLQHDLTIS
jgi:hypothetical protein